MQNRGIGLGSPPIGSEGFEHPSARPRRCTTKLTVYYNGHMEVQTKTKTLLIWRFKHVQTYPGGRKQTVTKGQSHAFNFWDSRSGPVESFRLPCLILETF